MLCQRFLKSAPKVRYVQRRENVKIFDQSSQTVNYQFNIAGDLNMDDAQSKQEAIDQLEKLFDHGRSFFDRNPAEPDI